MPQSPSHTTYMANETPLRWFGGREVMPWMHYIPKSWDLPPLGHFVMSEHIMPWPMSSTSKNGWPMPQSPSHTTYMTNETPLRWFGGREVMPWMHYMPKSWDLPPLWMCHFVMLEHIMPWQLSSTSKDRWNMYQSPSHNTYMASETPLGSFGGMEVMPCMQYMQILYNWTQLWLNVTWTG